MTTAIKQRPILFSTHMVRAILEGRKTMTRRIIKQQPEGRGLRWHNANTGWEDWHGKPVNCPYGKVGGELWVRETWWAGYQLDENDHIPEEAPLLYQYFADCRSSRPCNMSDNKCSFLFGNDKKEWPHWKSPIYMSKEACRLFLRITDIRIERLQDISQEDAQNEGVEWMGNGWRDYVKVSRNEFTFAKESFGSLWKSINGPESWRVNPFVWVISFERIEKPE